MNLKYITVDILKQLSACEDGIDFFTRNKLNGMPVSIIPKLNAYDHRVSWLIDVIVGGDIKIDCFGNITDRYYEDGYSYHKEFDGPGRVKYYEDGNGDITVNQYDDFGNMYYTLMKYNDSTHEIYRTFDDNGRLIHKTSNGECSRYEYNDDGNIKLKLLPNSLKYTYDYDDNGNLIECECNGHTQELYEYNSKSLITLEDKQHEIVRYYYNDEGDLIKKTKSGVNGESPHYILNRTLDNTTYTDFEEYFLGIPSKSWITRKLDGTIIMKTTKSGESSVTEYFNDDGYLTSIDRTGSVQIYILDDHNNVVETVINGSHKASNEIEYYQDGQLKRFNELEIPFFNKTGFESS